MYGLQKGALGAEIDKSGTPFDQAELMVALLNQAGFVTSYMAGTIVLTQAQFNAWTGITNARAACQLLANGGVPATVNGVTNALCSTLASGSAVSSVEMAHIWVKVTISGTDYVFDPSFKTYTWKTGIPLATAMVFTSGIPAFTTRRRAAAIRPAPTPASPMPNRSMRARSIPTSRATRPICLPTSKPTICRVLRSRTSSAGV